MIALKSGWNVEVSDKGDVRLWLQTESLSKDAELCLILNDKEISSTTVRASCVCFDESAELHLCWCHVTDSSSIAVFISLHYDQPQLHLNQTNYMLILSFLTNHIEESLSHCMFMNMGGALGPLQGQGWTNLGLTGRNDVSTQRWVLVCLPAEPQDQL